MLCTLKKKKKITQADWSRRELLHRVGVGTGGQREPNGADASRMHIAEGDKQVPRRPLYSWLLTPRGRAERGGERSPGPGRATQDHGQWPPGKPRAWGPRGAPWAGPRPAFPLEWVWPPWAPLVSGPRSSRLGPQQLPSTPLSDCDHPSGSVWL